MSFYEKVKYKIKIKIKKHNWIPIEETNRISQMFSNNTLKSLDSPRKIKDLVVYNNKEIPSNLNFFILLF